jgi:hypothetical protein
VQRTVDNVMEALYRIAETMDRPLPLSPQDVRLHLGRRTPLPLVAWRDLDETAVARFVEHAGEFPGAELTVEPVRVYPQTNLACHLLGYVGRADLEKLPDAAADGEPEKYTTTCRKWRASRASKSAWTACCGRMPAASWKSRWTWPASSSTKCRAARPARAAT